jgi:hypothetical protein
MLPANSCGYWHKLTPCLPAGVLKAKNPFPLNVLVEAESATAHAPAAKRQMRRQR